MKKKRPKRRNAVQTRLAILNSARKFFAERGYDGVGVREIASGAGVTAILVNRYFGSKEKLFIEAAKTAMDNRAILTPENLASANFPRAIAEALVRITEADATPLEGFKILVKSAGSRAAARIGRKLISEGHQREMKEILKGGLSAERAGIILSIVAGFQMMRQTLRLPDLARAKENELVELLIPLFEELVRTR